jgi:hypothetical protein
LDDYVLTKIDDWQEGDDYDIFVNISEKLIELEPDQVINITHNKRKKIFTIYDDEADSDMDIEEENDQPLIPLNQQRTLLKLRDGNSSNSSNDTSFRNIGDFTINVNIPIYENYTQSNPFNITQTTGIIPIPNGYEGLGEINYSVSIPTPVYPTVTFNTITNKNTTYTLSQLTSNQSEYFSKNSIIKTNISTLQIYFKTKFKYSRSDNVLKTPTWYYVSSDRTITLAAKEAVYVFRNGNGQLNLYEHISDNENNDGTANLKTGDYYFKISTNQTTNNVILNLWYDGNLFKETKFSESDTTTPDYFFNGITYLNSQFSSS